MTTVAVPLLVVGAAFASEPVDYTKLKAEFAKKQLVIRDREIKRIDDKLKDNEAKAKELKAKKPRTVAEKKNQMDSLARFDEENRRLENSKKSVAKRAYALRPTDMKVGDFGLLGANYDVGQPPFFTVLQVIDENNVLMRWGEKTYWVEMETKGMVDDDKIKMTDFVHAVATKQYESASGKRTVLLLKVVK